ncbi:hypothetical protein PENSPDRAFT_755835 [Peniophora sp. CONT]|nr:hypothetical protein PENSPDRAFT_755835 [Peniophora sp. CONT]
MMDTDLHPRGASQLDDTLPDDPRRFGDIIWKLYTSGEPGNALHLDKAINATRLAVELAQESADPELLFNLGLRLNARFERVGEIDDLQGSIMAYERAVGLMSDTHDKRLANKRRSKKSSSVAFVQPILTFCRAIGLGTDDDDSSSPALLCNYGASLRERFHRLGNVEDLENSVKTLRIAVDIVLEDDPVRPTCLDNLSRSLLSRFEYLGDFGDVETSISASRQALRLRVDGHPIKPFSFGDLGSSLLARFQHLGELEDVNAAISAQRRAIELLPNAHPQMATCLANLGSSLLRRFECIGNHEDIEDGIAAHRRSLELTPDRHPIKPSRFNSIGNSLLRRFDRFGVLENLEEAISAYRYAVDRTPEHDPNKRMYWGNLGISLSTRFNCLGRLDDVEAAISALRCDIALTSDAHPGKPSSLSSLGSALQMRFDRLGELEDIEAAVSFHQLAVDLTLDGQPLKASYLNNLGISLRYRYERLASLEDLEASISAHNRALELVSEGHPDKPAYLANLGSSYKNRFQRLGELNDIDAAVLVSRNALILTPNNHPKEPSRSNWLGNALSLRFSMRGELQDINDAISAHRSAVERTPDGHNDKPDALNNLGRALLARFDFLGELEDLDAAIPAFRRSSDLISNNDSRKSTSLSNFGSSLDARFLSLGQIEDLETAILAHRRAVSLIPDNHARKPSCLNNLGSSLFGRYRRFKQRNDLEAVITAVRSAADLTAETHVDKPSRLSNIGYCLRRRFEDFGELADIDDAILTQRRVIDLVPDDDHPRKPWYLNHLGNSLRLRFKRLSELKDIEAAITAQRLAVRLALENDPYKPLFLSDLGQSLLQFFEHGKMPDGFSAAMQSFMRAITRPLGPPLIRLGAALSCILMTSAHPTFSSTEQTLSAYRSILNTLPEIVWLGHGVSQRYNESAKYQLGFLVNAAVSAAIDAKALPLAVESFEAGRSLIWSQMLALRAPLKELEQHHHTLAGSLHAIRSQLRKTSHLPLTLQSQRVELFEDNISSLAENVIAERHREVVYNYERLLSQVRACVGFENFLRPIFLSCLRSMSGCLDDYVVLINIELTRCDALILIDDQEAKLVILPDITHEIVQNMCALWKMCLQRQGVRLQRGDRGTKWVEDDEGGEQHDWMRVLGTLWRLIVSPILKAFDLMKPTSGHRLPHVTWCPTGSLTQLPLHAAGLYNTQDGPRVYDYIISSYTPSLSALQRCRDGVQEGLAAPKVLVVTQPNTPRAGLAPLPFVSTECEHLRAILPIGHKHTFLEHEEGTVESTLNVVGWYPWVHFACHGSQKLGDPTQSAFELYDAPLTLSTLMGTVADNAELAFLSACQTAKGDESIPEESAHLAAGMLAVGFKGVVATTWTIQDSDAPVIVKAYYTKLLELRSSGTVEKGQTGAAFALHEAASHLRQEVGEDKFERWIPFVHFGV